MSKQTRIFTNPHKIPCEIYNCYNRGLYFVGRPDATKAATFRICAECLNAILSNLNEDQVQTVVQAAESRGILPSEPSADQPGNGNQPVRATNNSEAQEEAEKTRVESKEYGPHPAETNEDTLKAENQSKKEAEVSIALPPDQKLKAELQNKKVDELKDLAKDHEIDKYYEMTKAELVEALVNKGVKANGNEGEEN